MRIHKIDQSEGKTFFRIKRITILVTSFLGTLVILNIWVSHSLASFGEKFEEIESLQKVFIRENQMLENEIASSSSLVSIASQSASVGLNKLKNVQYIR